jgi:transcriptional regulator with XRE-family HTH domain
MAISGKNIRLIFGMKLRQKRLAEGLSLKELSERSDISISYLNEIEKGKKHPRRYKIKALSKALDLPYEELVSLQLNQKLSPVSELIRSNLLEDLPLEFLGIEESQLLELLSEAPAKFAAFVNSIIQIGRDYDIKVEHFYFSVLRSYQEMHDNFMPDIEKAAERFLAEHGINPTSDDTLEKLTGILEREYNYNIVYAGLEDHEELLSLRYLVIPGSKPELLLHPDLTPSQIKFIIGRELGYSVLKIKERSVTSSWIGSKHFDEVLNNYKAYYFSSAIITGGKKLVKDLEELIALDHFDPTVVRALLDKYCIAPEVLFHRLTSLIPHFLRFNEIFFFRYNHDLQKDRFTLTKELHGSGIPKHHGADLSEKACSRWSAVNALRKYHVSGTTDPYIEINRVNYENSLKEYLIITVAGNMDPTPGMNYSVSIGFVITQRFSEKVRFLSYGDIDKHEIKYSWIEHSSEFCDDNIEDPAIRKRQLKALKLREAVTDLLAQKL